MLVRAAETGDWPQAASLKDSVPMARLRLINSIANIARCFGVPNGTGVPATESSSGPSRLNLRRVHTPARCPQSLLHEPPASYKYDIAVFANQRVIAVSARITQDRLGRSATPRPQLGLMRAVH